MHCAFSADGKYFVTLGGAPDWNLYVWHWDKQKLIAAAKGVGWGNANGAAAYQCDFCPVDNTVLCVSGNGFVRFLRQQEGMLRPVQPSATPPLWSPLAPCRCQSSTRLPYARAPH